MALPLIGMEGIMSKSVSIIQGRVSEELAKGSTIDVYRLASMIHGLCPDLTIERVAELVSESVAKNRGNAHWIKETTISH